MTQATVKHRIDSDKNRKRFWAEASNLALDEKDVYAALSKGYPGVERVHDFPGTTMEAIALLHAYVEGSEKLNETQPAFEMPEGAELKHGTDELYEYCTRLPEAPVWGSTKFYDRDGFLWTISLLAGLPAQLAQEAVRSVMDQMILFQKAAKHNKWVPANGNYIPYDKPTGTVAPPLAAPPAPQPSGNGGSTTGSNKLNAIKVDADGRVEFHVDGFKWPFKDSRGAETAIQVFEPSAGNWTVDHLAPGSNHTGLNLSCDWERVTKFVGEQEKKYYNVLRVYVPEHPFGE